MEPTINQLRQQNSCGSSIRNGAMGSGEPMAAVAVVAAVVDGYAAIPAAMF